MLRPSDDSAVAQSRYTIHCGMLQMAEQMLHTSSTWNATHIILHHMGSLSMLNASTRLGCLDRQRHCQYTACNLKQEDLIFALADRSWLFVSDSFEVFLHGSHHGWRSAQKQLHCSWHATGSWHVMADHFLRDEAYTLRPACRGVVEDVVHSQTRGMQPLERIELFLQQNVVCSYVGVQ